MDKFIKNDYVKVMTTKSSSDCSAQTENMILAVGYVESIVSNSNPQDEKIIVKCIANEIDGDGFIHEIISYPNSRWDTFHFEKIEFIKEYANG